MARTLSILVLALLASCWSATPLAACRYTVRDVAFVDLNDVPYRIFVIADKNERADLPETVRNIATETLQDANVIVEFVDTSNKDHLAHEYASDVKQFPAVVAVGPEQQSLILAEGLSADPRESAEKLDQLCEAFIDSPARREMFEKLLGVHSVILVVDGTDANASATTLEMVRQTIPQVEQSLEYLPKPIKEPPHLIHLTEQEAEKERVLLWSLGMDRSLDDSTQVALLFGRGRKLGPVLHFPEDPRRRFIRSLAVVGQDCECGLDRRWMQGPMVPHRWTTDDEKVAIEKLGFDPGNPLVKAEIDRILTRGPGAEGGRNIELEDSLQIAPALSYQEIALEDPATDSPLQKSADELLATVRTGEGGHDASTGNVLREESESVLPQTEKVDTATTDKVAAETPLPALTGRWSYLLLIGSALVVVTIGLLILLRSGEAAA